MLLLGLMSGTSTDGVDAVLVRLADDQPLRLAVVSHCHLPMPAALRGTLLDLNTSAPDELHTAALAANALSRLYADAVRQTLRRANVASGQVRAIGAHGQTVRHRPGAFDGTGYTLQLLNGALLAELSGIDVVCDFRSRDVAAGGQGAPLVPAFHAALWSVPGQTHAVLNLGGIANLSLLHADGRVTGFDCGPGNVLLDLWSQRHLGTPFDDDGRWACGGRVDERLLARLLSEPFFAKAPPKSTGRDLFHAGWLDDMLADPSVSALSARDVQSTLAELTVVCAVRAVQRQAADARRLLVCGGGALNGELMRRLEARLPGSAVETTAAAGLPPQQVEGAAFAWLAGAHLDGRPGNRPEVTGAAGPRILGALYPAG